MARSAPARRPNAGVSAPTDHAAERPAVFTAAEAGASLVYLRPVVSDVRASFARVVRHRRLLDRASLPEDSRRRERVQAGHRAEMARLAALVDEVQAVGAQLRDFEAGALAFPSEDHGVPAGGYLSWIDGEEAVTFAHGPDEPTEARRPVLPKARRRAA